MIRLEMNRKQEAILAAIIIFAALGVFVLYAMGLGQEPEPAPAPPPSLSETVQAQIGHFNDLDDTLFNELESGLYQLDNPLIVVNPYGTSPLTAIVLFQTAEPMRISVNIPGKTEDVSIQHTFDGFETSHFIPIYGLYPESANLIEIIAQPLSALENSGGAGTLSTLLLIETEGIPGDFSDKIIVTPKTTVSSVEFDYPDIRYTDEEPFEVTYNHAVPESSEFYFTFMRKAAYDASGDCRWVYDGYGTRYPTQYTDYGTMFIIAGSFDEGDALLLEVNMLGRILSAEPVGRTFEIGGHGANHIERGTLYPVF